METMTISQVSKTLGISTRMLRYYEQEGLICSSRRADYAYRIYDKQAISRLKQIIVLRKLRIPVRQIKMILLNPAAVSAIDIFRENINQIDGEITALATIRDILNRFVEELKDATALPLEDVIVLDDTLLTAIHSLSLISINFMEDQTMEHLQKATERLGKLEDVRIIYLPPATVATAHHIGDDPETHANDLIDKFVRENQLHKKKPDIRHYGFNHPNPVDKTGYHGYETWVTIPDDMEVPAPLVKKEFSGGLYAAHMIAFGNFDQWGALLDWINQSGQYEFAGDMQDQEHMCGLLDEHLNYVSHVELENTEPADLQLDLLAPVKKK